MARLLLLVLKPQFCPPRVERWGLCMARLPLRHLCSSFSSPSGALGPLHGPPSSAALVQQFVLPEWSTEPLQGPSSSASTCAAVCPPRVEHWGLWKARLLLLAFVQQFVLPVWSTGASAWPISSAGTCAAVCPPQVEHWGLWKARLLLLALEQQFVNPVWSIRASAWPIFFCWHLCSSLSFPIEHVDVTVVLEMLCVPRRSLGADSITTTHRQSTEGAVGAYPWAPRHFLGADSITTIHSELLSFAGA
jgi:hypothetical protein